MATLSIFANFRINDEERFLRMKDSFNSFRDLPARKWVINARGKYKEETLAFLTERLGNKLIPYRLESKQGWMHDTKQMLSNFDTDFVFFWVEDHINLVPADKYQAIIDEMKDAGSEYLTYSWWHDGRPIEVYRELNKKETANIYAFNIDRPALDLVKKKYSPFIMSIVGIFSTDLFKKIVTETGPFLRQYSKFCPFNFEKGPGETRWLPVRTAIPKMELAASIDDGPGYCLQDRGLYPIRELRNVPIQPVPSWKSFFRSRLKPFIPAFVYHSTLPAVILFGRIRTYLKLVLSGQ